MSATYDPTLPTERDFIRFLIGDTNPLSPNVSDEEIDALITDSRYGAIEARKYFIAADLLSILFNKWYGMTSRGVTTKSVGRLSISFGTTGFAQQAMKDRIKELRARAIFLLSGVPRNLRVLGPRRRAVLNNGRIRE